MKRLLQFIAQTLSVRLSLMVALSTAVLLLASLIIVLHFSQKVLRKEAMQKAEQALDATMQHIDNALLGVEQASGNIYWSILEHPEHPERMFTYCQKLVETNPYIMGAAIAFKPYYYKERGEYFMAYVYQTPSNQLSVTDSPVIQSSTFGNRPYTEQEWYTKTIAEGHPLWIGPLQSDDSYDGSFLSFCLPLYSSEGQCIGVLGVDVPLSRLSRIVLATKPSPNSYCTLLGRDGSYIVHPDSMKLLQQQTVYSYYKDTDNNSIREAAEAMVSGQTGYQEFRQTGMDWCVFYKPFQRASVPGRAQEHLGWSVGIVYPEDDILGEYHALLYYVLAIALGGIVVLLVVCQVFTHRWLLPLQMLTQSAQRIAGGSYDEPIPDSRQDDEIGRLQKNFQQMQQSLAAHVSELERLRKSLTIQGEELRVAYRKAQEADRMKTSFLNNMSNQMIAPSEAIATSVDSICSLGRDLSHEEAERLTDDIRSNSQTIVDLLSNLLTTSNETTGKEDAHA